MKFRYTQFPSRDKNFPYFIHPLVNVTFYTGPAKYYKVKGIIDSGADQTLLNADIAKQWNIDYKKLPLSQTVGIDGKPIKVYLFDLEMELDQIANSRVRTRIGFIQSTSVGVLLGKYGFLEHFRITLEAYNEEFYVELKPPPPPIAGPPVP